MTEGKIGKYPKVLVTYSIGFALKNWRMSAVVGKNGELSGGSSGRTRRAGHAGRGRGHSREWRRGQAHQRGARPRGARAAQILVQEEARPRGAEADGVRQARGPRERRHSGGEAGDRAQANGAQGLLPLRRARSAQPR